MKSGIRVSILYGALFLCLFAEVGKAEAQKFDKFEKRIHDIEEFSASTCGNFSSSGKSYEYNGTAGGSANLSKDIEKFLGANLGLKGSFQIKKYSGLLQKDIISSNNNVSACKLNLVNSLKEILIQAGKESENIEKTLPQISRDIPNNYCGNSLIYYSLGNIPHVYNLESVTNCKFAPLTISPSSAADALIIDKNPPHIDIIKGSSAVTWPIQNHLLFTIFIKNTGNTTVYVKNSYIISHKIENLHDSTAFFPESYTLRPGEEYVVPISSVEDLAKLVDEHYDRTARYTASTDSSEGCPDKLPDDFTKAEACSEIGMGFGISIRYTDIFGYNHQYNHLAILHKINNFR